MDNGCAGECEYARSLVVLRLNVCVCSDWLPQVTLNQPSDIRDITRIERIGESDGVLLVGMATVLVFCRCPLPHPRVGIGRCTGAPSCERVCVCDIPVELSFFLTVQVSQGMVGQGPARRAAGIILEMVKVRSCHYPN